MRIALGFVVAGCLLGGCQETPKNSAPATMAKTGGSVMGNKVVAALPALVDQVVPGDEAGERAHNQKGENTETGDWTERTYRHSPDGWFSWDMKVDPNVANELVVTYAGVDKRTFEILIDGKSLSKAEQTGADADFYEQKFPLPPDMTKGKQKVTVRFQSMNNEYAGGVFGLKVMRAGK